MSDKEKQEKPLTAHQRAAERGWRVVDGDKDKKPEKFPIIDINEPPGSTMIISPSNSKEFTALLPMYLPKIPFIEQNIPLRNKPSSYTDDDGVTYFPPDSETNEIQNKPSQLIKNKLKEDLYKDGVEGWMDYVVGGRYYRRVLKGKAGYEGAKEIVEQIVTDGRSEWQQHVFIDTQDNDIIVKVTKKLFDERVKNDCIAAADEARSLEK